MNTGCTAEELDEAIEQSGRTEDDFLHIWITERLEAVLTNDLRASEWYAMAETASTILEEHGISSSEDAPDFRLLCFRLLRAQIEGLKAIVARAKGNWNFEPSDPLLRVRPATPMPFPSVVPPPTPPPNVVPVSSPKAAKSEKPITDLITMFLKEKERSGLTNKTVEELKRALRWMVEFFGHAKATTSYTKADIVEYKAILSELPARWQLHYPTATMREAIERGKQDGHSTMEVQALNGKRLMPIDQFFQWAADNAFIENNPARGVRLTVSKALKTAKKRDGFSIEQLNAMFRTPTYTGMKSAYHWKEPGRYLPKDECYWIPLVALFTGGRRREICQLLTADVREIDGIPCIDINEEGTKSTKNAHSIRTIPVHPELKRLGFLEYVKARRSANKKALFDAAPGNSCTYDPFGKWFSRFLDTIGIDSRRLVFHSFRHTFEQAMLDAQIDFRYACFLGGRTLDHSSSQYVTRPPAQSLLAELSKVSYPGLDLSHLYVMEAELARR
ncbi:site-specific integrase [Magnetospirillum moscoviense]|uniref:Tyr recombinase domain-containing protein n=1 Tax=Magnetospirillum moscoviense TaxID=1437059 RepID=A0A178MZ76_9PROT|nr:site-specific integrase [Magnetospirillum moscoviense]OAN62843.1 hypothetical protein A6A05_19235 [Magnetospirillum moscoviense]